METKIAVGDILEVIQILKIRRIKFDKVVTLLNGDREYKMGSKVVCRWHWGRKVMIIF